MKALMKYPGSKWGSADWIISHFPEHHSYLEPFFGSGGVFFNKPRSDIETINDLDVEVVNLFRQIRNDPERLAREIYFTPYSREAYEMAYQKEPENDLEKAVLFYTRLNMGHGFRTQGEKVGWKLDVQGRERAYAAADWCKIPEKIMEAAERLRGVQIENRPAIISGYSSPLYEERLKDWYREERINYAQNAQQRREVIWCNQKTEKTAQQLTLF